MGNRNELPPVNKAISVIVVAAKRGKSGIIRTVDLSRVVDPNAPPPDDKAIQSLLQEAREAKGGKHPGDFFLRNKRQKRQK